ncbi:HNH endonuclease [Thermoplasmatota archaeon]
MAKTYVGKKGYKRYSNSGKSVHRHVASRKLGGKIWKGRVVHHRDGNKLNNSRSNLQVMKRSSHSRLHATKRKKRWFW